MIFWRVIRFSDETEATNWDSSGCWSCLPAVEWDVGEVGARNVAEAACITLKLLLYYDWFVLKKCFGKLLWGIMLPQWPVVHYHSFNTGLQTHEDLQKCRLLWVRMWNLHYKYIIHLQRSPWQLWIILLYINKQQRNRINWASHFPEFDHLTFSFTQGHFHYWNFSLMRTWLCPTKNSTFCN